MIGHVVFAAWLIPAVFTHPFPINGFAHAKDRTFAATGGGLVEISPLGTRVWTTAHGLPSNEVRNVRLVSGRLKLDTPKGSIRLMTGLNDQGGQNLAVKGQQVAGVKEPLKIGTGFITGAARTKDGMYAAVYGSGLFQSVKGKWVPVISPPNITALSAGPRGLWLGTEQEIQPPFGDPIRFDGVGSNQILDLVVSKEKLWVAHADTAAQTYDGGRWQPVAFRKEAVRKWVPYGKRDPWFLSKSGVLHDGEGKAVVLPRGKVSAVAASSTTLYASQWGGWSSFDGSTWAHHFDQELLANKMPTVLLPTSNGLLIGTQDVGLLRWKDGELSTVASGVELEDDWVTAAATVGETLLVGTFIGGLTVLSERPTRFLDGENVTAIESDTSGAWIGTRNGLWRLKSGRIGRVRSPAIPSEVQCLAVAEGWLWIGTRTGLVRISPASAHSWVRD